MFESYMKKADGIWDFTLFDQAFWSAEKHGIKVFGTIFPYTEKTDIGGFKFLRNEVHLQSITLFIKQLTTNFSKFESLDGWVLINEPGVGRMAITIHRKYGGKKTCSTCYTVPLNFGI